MKEESVEIRLGELFKDFKLKKWRMCGLRDLNWRAAAALYFVVYYCVLCCSLNLNLYVWIWMSFLWGGGKAGSGIKKRIRHPHVHNPWEATLSSFQCTTPDTRNFWTMCRVVLWCLALEQSSFVVCSPWASEQGEL
jgi:hypothetical protein